MGTLLKIKVTKEILERSKMCGDSSDAETLTNCAIALAIRGIFPRAVVTDTSFRPFGYDKAKTRICLPISARVFINQFDESSPEERIDLPEIGFTISIPDEVIEKINIEELRPLLENHPNLQFV